jgi:hypothetical protein
LFLPANLTSAHQPCDQGIIAALKKRYKTQMLLELERNVESVEMFHARRQQAKDEGRRACEAGLAYGFRAHVLDAMSLLKQAWDAITTETIVHCWRKAHCLHEIFAETEIVADELDAGLLDAMKKLQVAAAVIKADDSAVDVFSDVVKTIGSLSI